MQLFTMFLIRVAQVLVHPWVAIFIYVVCMNVSLITFAIVMLSTDAPVVMIHIAHALALVTLTMFGLRLLLPLFGYTIESSKPRIPSSS